MKKIIRWIPIILIIIIGSGIISASGDSVQQQSPDYRNSVPSDLALFPSSAQETIFGSSSLPRSSDQNVDESASVLPTVSTQSAQSTEINVSKDYAPDRVIVKYKTSSVGAQSESLDVVQAASNQRVGAEVIADLGPMGVPGMQMVKVSGTSVPDAIASYQKNPLVEYAEPDYKISLDPTLKSQASDESAVQITSVQSPNDPKYSLLWALHNGGQAPFGGKSGADIDAPDAWGVTTGSNSVVVAVVDTGVDYTHPDLSANIWTNPNEIPDNGIDDDGNGYVDDVRGWNFVAKTNNPMDDNGHGTHVSGTIGAVGNNNVGITGVDWNVKIMPLKFLDSTGDGYVSDAVSAILYANKKSVPVISCSWGGNGYTQALKDAIDASSAVVVCAAGNSKVNTDLTPSYPASYTSPNIISVAATDYNDNLASFSNYGATSVDLAAPGVGIASTYPNSQYYYMSGTSMATPHVSGVAALIKAANPSFSSSQIKSMILSSVDPLSGLSGKTVTGGRLDAYKALGSSQNSNPVPAPTTSPAPVTTPTIYPGKLTASFTATPVLGKSPLSVQFTDSSTGGATSWVWFFGDGGVSYQKNPVYTFTKKGTYSVKLVASNSARMSYAYKPRLITVW